VRFCTIAHAATLPHARVLSETLANHHPGCRLTVLVAGPEALLNRDEPFDVMHLDRLGVSKWERLLEECSSADLQEFLKPHLLRRLIADGADSAVYLQVAVDVHAPLDPVLRELGRRGAVVVPRVLRELPTDGRRPNRRDLLQAGRFGASLVAVDRRAMAVDLLDWWADRLAGAAEQLSGTTGDETWPSRELSRWLDFAPSVFGEISVLADLGSAVSYWNLHERRLYRDHGEVVVEGRPLRFFHFEGFDPTRPFLLNAQMDRLRTSENPSLARLCESYSARLERAGWHDYQRRREVGRRLPNGLTFDDRLSHLLATACAGGDMSDVFSEEGAEAFIRWLEGPAPHGSDFGISRYLYRVYEERPDLRPAYPDIDGTDGEEFAAWAWVFGRAEMDIPERFLPPRPAGVRAASRMREAVSARTRAPLPRGPKPDLSVRVTGMLTGTLGLGEAARGYVRAIQGADVPVSTSSVDLHKLEPDASPHDGYAQVEYADLAGLERAGFDLVCINADELLGLERAPRAGLFGGRPTIGVWAWETDHIPERWNPAFELLDEIWVYSNYVARNLGKSAPIPVYRIPPAVLPPDPGEVKLDLGVPSGFQFLFMFDFFSTIQRKNPVGLIEAFRQAFEPGEGPQLVVKTLNGIHRRDALEEVLWAARSRPDVHVLDRSLTARERDALVTGCDCYVSLHRSEGFGLPLAECMALGKPVIGTAFSGTTDFMTDENSYLVPYEMTNVGADCEIYPAEGTWAEPDVREAARLMRRVLERRDEARAKGERAHLDVARLYSPEAVGELIRSRLESLRELWTKGTGDLRPAARSDEISHH
jgi:glycosyltransferase involved in cell wall biosynthesis